jgi:hypothetical protein
MINAAIYIGPDLPWDGDEARQCHDQVMRRDYHLATLLRDWDDLDQVLDADDVEVVVFPARLVRNAKTLDPDITRVLRRHNAAVGRHHVPAPPSEHGVREIRFGDGIRRGEPEYGTAPILPRGNDGGFAERFLKDRRRGA